MNNLWEGALRALTSTNSNVTNYLGGAFAAIAWSGATPLYIAAENGHTESITLLLQGGAAVDAKGPDGWSPLMIAAHNGHKESITLLLQGGAAVDAKLEVRGALLS